MKRKFSPAGDQRQHGEKDDEEAPKMKFLHLGSFFITVTGK
ncbi:hypothetical protein [Bacillus cereus]|nr:hypothetical protein [Bacillus cereus]